MLATLFFVLAVSSVLRLVGFVVLWLARFCSMWLANFGFSWLSRISFMWLAFSSVSWLAEICALWLAISCEVSSKDSGMGPSGTSLESVDTDEGGFWDAAVNARSSRIVPVGCGCGSPQPRNFFGLDMPTPHGFRPSCRSVLSLFSPAPFQQHSAERCRMRQVQ
jgi:hypothetical protein